MKKQVVDFITLGCSKNLVDTENLMTKFERAGFKVTHDAANPKGRIVVVNTCGFIGDAKEESIEVILQQAMLDSVSDLPASPASNNAPYDL